MVEKGEGTQCSYLGTKKCCRRPETFAVSVKETAKQAPLAPNTVMSLSLLLA